MELENKETSSINVSIHVLLYGLEQDSRVVVTKPFSSGSPAGKGQQEAGPNRGEEGVPSGAGRGQKKHLMVTMAGKKVNTQM